MNYEYFIIDYLDKEEESNLKNLMSSNLSKTFNLNKENTYISSKLEQIIENKGMDSEKIMGDGMKYLNLKLDKKLERSKLNRVRNYIDDESMKIKNMFPYEQKKLRRSENDEINRIFNIEKEKKIFNILDKIKILNEKIKKYNDTYNFKEKDSEIQVEMASDQEENMEIEN